MLFASSGNPTRHPLPTHDPFPPDPQPARPTPRIAVIGTGITGTSAACQILSAGLDCTLFEAGPDPRSVGGIWTAQNADSGLQIPSDFYAFHPDVRWSREFPRRDEILGQARGLWGRFGLGARCVFGCFVERLVEVGDGGRFLVNGEEGYGAFDGVVVAVGTCGGVSVPCIPGLEDFGGRTCHSSRLGSVDVRGKKVVVVGGGASAVEAMEFAVDHGAKSVAVVTRSEKWVIPRWRLLNCLMAAVIFDPFGFCEKAIEWLLRFFYYRDLPASAIPKNLKVFSKTPVCSDRFFDLLRSGTVRWIKADCHRLVESGLEITPHDPPSSSSAAAAASRQPASEKTSHPTAMLEPCSILVYATGYTRPPLPTLYPLAATTSPKTHSPPSWYLQVFPPGSPQICALNSTWLEGIGSVGSPLIGFYTRLLCVFASDVNSRPSAWKMEKWVWVVKRVLKPGRGLGFVTAAEVYAWFLVMVLVEREFWGWRGLFVLFGEGRLIDWEGWRLW